MVYCMSFHAVSLDGIITRQQEHVEWFLLPPIRENSVDYFCEHLVPTKFH
jgi:hypothetical protein